MQQRRRRVSEGGDWTQQARKGGGKGHGDEIGGGGDEVDGKFKARRGRLAWLWCGRRGGKERANGDSKELDAWQREGAEVGRRRCRVRQSRLRRWRWSGRGAALVRHTESGSYGGDGGKGLVGGSHGGEGEEGGVCGEL